MKIKLIGYQEHALELLLYTKDTRLQGSNSLDDIIAWPHDKKMEHYSYMKDTIKSSFEFVKYTFELKEVSRGFIQQLTRTRTQNYAQESMRAVDVRDANFYNDGMCEEYDFAVETSIKKYSEMIDGGIQIQDARGVLPIDTLTSIIVGTDLRTMHETAKVRLCYRSQGEYQEVFKRMRGEVAKVHPWAVDMINVACVDSGVCCFPRYTECPIQDFTVKVPSAKKLAIQIAWDLNTHQANPVATNGVTMI